MPQLTRKTNAYTLKVLVHFAQQNTRLLLVDTRAFLLNPTSHDHWYVDSAFDTLRAAEWITAPAAIGPGVAECFLTETGRDMAAAIQSAKRGYTQLELEAELLAAQSQPQPQPEEKEEEAAMPVITFDYVSQYVGGVTAEQIGKCHLTYDAENQPFFCVENEAGDIGLDLDVIQYAVRYSPERGFTCTCAAGYVGFAHVHHRSGVCKHVRWCVALIMEERAGMDEMTKGDKSEGNNPRPDWYNPENKTSYFDGTRRNLLLVGKLEADDATYARVMNAQPYPWTEAEIRRDQRRFQAHPFDLLGLSDQSGGERHHR